MGHPEHEDCSSAKWATSINRGLTNSFSSKHPLTLLAMHSGGFLAPLIFVWVTGTTQVSNIANLRSCVSEGTYADIPGKTILTEMEERFRNYHLQLIK